MNEDIWSLFQLVLFSSVWLKKKRQRHWICDPLQSILVDIFSSHSCLFLLFLALLSRLRVQPNDDDCTSVVSSGIRMDKPKKQPTKKKKKKKKEIDHCRVASFFLHFLFCFSSTTFSIVQAKGFFDTLSQKTFFLCFLSISPMASSPAGRKEFFHACFRHSLMPVPFTI